METLPRSPWVLEKPSHASQIKQTLKHGWVGVGVKWRKTWWRHLYPIMEHLDFIHSSGFLLMQTLGVWETMVVTQVIDWIQFWAPGWSSVEWTSKWDSLSPSSVLSLKPLNNYEVPFSICDTAEPGTLWNTRPHRDSNIPGSPDELRQGLASDHGSPEELHQGLVSDHTVLLLLLSVLTFFPFCPHSWCLTVWSLCSFSSQV